MPDIGIFDQFKNKSDEDFHENEIISPLACMQI